MSNATLDTIRKSVRPIDGKIHGVCEHESYKELPEYFQKYKPYTHKEVLEAMESKEWNIYMPLLELERTYDREYVESEFEAERFLESFGQAYIAVFTILKFKFFRFSWDYLNDKNKWSVFNTPKLERANEYTMLTLCYFFDQISYEDFERIDRFRGIRNALCHQLEHKYSLNEMKESLTNANDFISRELHGAP